MRRMMIVATVLALGAAACSDSGALTTTAGEDTTTSTAAAVTTAPEATTTTTGAPAPTSTSEPAATTTGPGETTTTEAGQATTTTTGPAPTTTIAPTTTAPDAVFTITAVVFGENGFVEITNVGAAEGDVSGHWLCQRPAYFEIPAQVLQPGESAWVATGAAPSAASATAVAVFGAEGRLGQFSPRSGEVALYEGSTFSDPDRIRGFVEWGPEGGLPRAGRGGVAVEAGIWEEGTFVVVADGAIGVTATSPPTDGPEDWIGDVGG